MIDRLKRLVTADRARGLAVVVAAGVFLALTNAFGSGQSLAARLAYWVPVMIGAGLWGHLCASWLTDRGLDDRPPAIQFAVLTTAIGLPLALAVWFATGLMFEQRIYPLAVLPGFVWRVMLITAVMTVIALAMERRAASTSGAEGPPRFLSRMPVKLRGARLIAVQAEDHYLRIHTDRGSDLILMRLSDAVAELKGLDGARTHRSWWVARDAITDVRRGDGRARLTLEGGLEAPVSRRYARALRAAGWY